MPDHSAAVVEKDGTDNHTQHADRIVPRRGRGPTRAKGVNPPCRTDQVRHGCRNEPISICHRCGGAVPKPPLKEMISLRILTLRFAFFCCGKKPNASWGFQRVSYPLAGGWEDGVLRDYFRSFCTRELRVLPSARPAALAWAAFITAPICALVVAPTSAMASFTICSISASLRPAGR